MLDRVLTTRRLEESFEQPRDKCCLGPGFVPDGARLEEGMGLEGSEGALGRSLMTDEEEEGREDSGHSEQGGDWPSL